MIAAISGIPSKTFRRHAFWYWKIWIALLAGVHFWAMSMLSILRALGCVGYVTNGAVRELPSVRTTGVQVFAGSVAVSHAYAHIFDIGSKVSVGGMDIHPGDLLHGDQHGVLNIPLEIAGDVPRVATAMKLQERMVIDFCRSSTFSIAQLSEIMKKTLL